MSLSRHPRVGGDPVSSNSESIITEHIDLWTSSIKARNTQGRGSSKKRELYGIKKLRELILELAVRGKLVPQDPYDEPASVLLKRITEEKAQLIKDNKIKKQKPLPKIIDEEKPFDLPMGWSWVRLDQLAPMSLFDGDWIESKDQDLNGNIRLIQLGDVGVNIFKNVSTKYVNEMTFDKLNCTALLEGDVLIARLPNPIGRACIFPKIAEKAITAVDVAILRLRGLILDQYVVHAINSTSFRTQVESYGKGATRFRISTGNLKTILVPVAPKEEQHRIVAKVDELMALCDQLEQQTESSLDAHKLLVDTLLASLLKPAEGSLTDTHDANELSDNWARLADHFDTLITTDYAVEQLKQTILQLAVMGKLVPQDPNDEPASELLKRIAVEKEQLIKDKKIKKQKPLPEITDEEKPYELPRAWEWCRLPDLGDLARGKSKHRPRNDPSLYSDGKIPLVQTGDVSRANGVIETYTALYNEVGLAQSKLWPKGTMCITIAANIADTSVLGFDACFPDSVVAYTPFDDKIDARYFEFFIRTAKANLEKYAPSTAQKNINLEILSQLLVPCPPLEEISNIVAKIDELMGLCDQLKVQLSKAQITQLHLADAVLDRALG
ncbi:MAG: type I restriction enzyme S subunit [Candidatus Endobugula sp.]|jgi:type I restriction enzyme S subunit